MFVTFGIVTFASHVTNCVNRLRVLSNQAWAASRAQWNAEPDSRKQAYAARAATTKLEAAQARQQLQKSAASSTAEFGQDSSSTPALHVPPHVPGPGTHIVLPTPQMVMAGVDEHTDQRKWKHPLPVPVFKAFHQEHRRTRKMAQLFHHEFRESAYAASAPQFPENAAHPAPECGPVCRHHPRLQLYSNTVAACAEVARRRPSLRGRWGWVAQVGLTGLGYGGGRRDDKQPIPKSVPIRLGHGSVAAARDAVFACTSVSAEPGAQPTTRFMWLPCHIAGHRKGMQAFIEMRRLTSPAQSNSQGQNFEGVRLTFAAESFVAPAAGGAPARSPPSPLNRSTCGPLCIRDAQALAALLCGHTDTDAAADVALILEARAAAAPVSKVTIRRVRYVDESLQVVRVLGWDEQWESVDIDDAADRRKQGRQRRRGAAASQFDPTDLLDQMESNWQGGQQTLRPRSGLPGP